MYNGVGVRTARGTGTNGYVQKNFASLPSSKQKTHYEKQKELAAKIRPLSQLGPDKDILEHDRKRQIESRLMAWADEQGLLDSECASFAFFRTFLLHFSGALWY
jgi:serine/arginine repetitive matrix protein 2